MGYISKDIAIITEPKRITLSGLPNFITISGKPKAPVKYEFNLQVKATQALTGIESVTQLNVTDPTGVVYIFYGTTDATEVGGAIFFVSTDAANTAENLRQALLNNSWIAANFDVRVPFVWNDETPVNGNVISIVSKGAGNDYNITVAAPNNAGNAAYVLTPVNTDSTNGDSISGEASTAEIELDIYTDPAFFPGQDDRPMYTAQIGTYAVSLQKTYAGVPLWFELNSLFQNFAEYAVPPDVAGWFDADTARAYSFIAKVKGIDSYAFYQSSALFVINGYGRASDPIDMAEYTYGNGIFKALTNKPRTPYMRGQKAFLNFIFSDPDRGKPGITNYALQVAYSVYSTSDNYLGAVYNHVHNRNDFSIVNTCVLDIDAVLDQYPTAGIVRVALVRGDLMLTEEVEYEIRPDCLHTLTQFIFLNRLGGWDAFNFDASADDEVKPDILTYNKTLVPGHTKSRGIETVYDASIGNTRTVNGAPVSDDVAAWLKELVAARVILDGEGNYIVIEDFTLKVSSDTANMQVPTIKYHISETYTND